MPNTEGSELNHTFKATLIIPLGGREDHRVKLEGYPEHYGDVEHADGTLSRQVGTPLPKRIVFESGTTSWEEWLYSIEDISPCIRALQNNLKNILSAAIVNSKQLMALESLAKQAFDDFEFRLYQRD